MPKYTPSRPHKLLPLIQLDDYHVCIFFASIPTSRRLKQLSVLHLTTLVSSTIHWCKFIIGFAMSFTKCRRLTVGRLGIVQSHYHVVNILLGRKYRLINDNVYFIRRETRYRQGMHAWNHNIIWFAIRSKLNSISIIRIMEWDKQYILEYKLFLAVSLQLYMSCILYLQFLFIFVSPSYASQLVPSASAYPIRYHRLFFNHL